MASSFAITVTSSSLKLSADRSGSISVTVTNTSGRALRGRGMLEADPAALPWFSLSGQAERSFAAGATEQYVITIAAPPAAPAGSTTVRLNMVEVDNPDEDFTRGPTVTVEVPAPPQPVKKPFPWWIVAVVVAVLALGGAVGGWLLWRSVPVPDLVGLTAEDARQALEEAGLAAGTVDEGATGAIPGTVLAQEPAAGEQAARGSAVALTVEAARVLVPNLRTLTLNEARLALEQVGLTLANITYNPTGQTPGTITAQDPAPNAEVQRSAQIILNVEPERVPVPQLVGLSVDEARALLSELGLTSGAVTQVSTDPAKAGQVIQQSPPPETMVLLGETVALSVEKTPLLVPDLLALSQEQATAKLTEAGLRLGKVTPTVSKPNPPGLVLEQTPKAGEPILDNGEVSLTISAEPTQWRSGQLGITEAAGLGIDLDSAKAVAEPATDFYLSFGSGSGVAITPNAGARLVAYGPDRPGFSGCLASQWRSTPIPVEQLPVGSHFCVLTNQDRIAQVRVITSASSGTELQLAFVTWAKDDDRIFIFEPRFQDILEINPDLILFVNTPTP